MAVDREIPRTRVFHDRGKDLGRDHLVDFQKARPGRVNLGNVGTRRLGSGVSDTQPREIHAVVHHIFAIQ